MIVTQTFLGRHTDRGGLWKAECTVDGQHFEATSRSSAPHELARTMLWAGIPDEPMTILTKGLQGQATCASFWAMAKYTYTEGDALLRRVKWKPYRGAVAEGGEMGVNGPGEHAEALE